MCDTLHAILDIAIVSGQYTVVSQAIREQLIKRMVTFNGFLCAVNWNVIFYLLASCHVIKGTICRHHVQLQPALCYQQRLNTCIYIRILIHSYNYTSLQ